MTPAKAVGVTSANALTWAQLYANAAARLGSRHEARWLVEEVTGESWPPANASAAAVTTSARARFEALVARRVAEEPLQYVLGRWQFRTVDLMVDRRVLIPRPETEQVVDAALAELDRLSAPRPGRLLRTRTAGTAGRAGRAGTGGADGPHGADGAAGADGPAAADRPYRADGADTPDGGGRPRHGLGSHRPVAGGGATPPAGVGHGCLARRPRRGGRQPGRSGRVGCDPGPTGPGIVVGGAARGAPGRSRSRRVESALHLDSRNDATSAAEVAAWEPRCALEAGPTGLEALVEILTGARAWLRPGGAAVLEIAPHQSAQAAELARQAGLVVAGVRPDLAGRDRALVAHRAP